MGVRRLAAESAARPAESAGCFSGGFFAIGGRSADFGRDCAPVGRFIALPARLAEFTLLSKFSGTPFA